MVPNPPLDPLGGPDDRARALITGLLRECEPAAALLDFAALPLNHYQFTVALPGEIGKRLIVAEHLVQRAATNPDARRALRAYVRSELLRQRAQQAHHLASEARAAVLTRFCALCERPIMLGQRVQVSHAECPPS
jgi:hypothetical protein